ncbi:hypothetical protein [Thermaerobacillus caldiproteolyticus]|uniref:hypothetical protein n=1 Tax=Thermaerobacillus caldiproteolyticus TaxID=247480 RepID=UPI0018F1AD51|nr:hypothetical protein [Anoxybacillus caldiproteolyticus]
MPLVSMTHLLGMSIESIPHEKRATAMETYQALYAIGRPAISCWNVEFGDRNCRMFLLCRYIRIIHYNIDCFLERKRETYCLTYNL